MPAARHSCCIATTVVLSLTHCLIFCPLPLLQGNSAHLVESELRLVLEPESASSTGGTCSTGSTDQSAIQALPEPWEDAAGAAAQAEKAKEAGAQEGVGLGGAGAEGPSGAGSEKEAAQAVPTAAGKGKAAVASGSGTSSSGGPGARTEASFVVLRGCVPCMWAAPPDLRARPKARIARSSEAQAAALHAHVAGLSKAYKVRLSVLRPQWIGLDEKEGVRLGPGIRPVPRQ